MARGGGVGDTGAGPRIWGRVGGRTDLRERLHSMVGRHAEIEGDGAACSERGCGVGACVARARRGVGTAWARRGHGEGIWGWALGCRQHLSQPTVQPTVVSRVGQVKSRATGICAARVRGVCARGVCTRLVCRVLGCALRRQHTFINNFQAEQTAPRPSAGAGLPPGATVRPICQSHCHYRTAKFSGTRALATQDTSADHARFRPLFLAAVNEARP